MSRRGKIAAGLAGLAAAAALAAPFTLLSSSGGGIDVFVGSTPTPSATVIPTVTPTETPSRTTDCSPELEDTMTNDVSHECGFADVTNTGPNDEGALVQVGGSGGITSPTTATGSGWSFSGGQLSISTNNAVLKNADVRGTIAVSNASGVTIQNFKVLGGGIDVYGIRLQNADNITIEHGEIRGLAQFTTNRLDTGIRDMVGSGQPSDNMTVKNVEMIWTSSCMNNIQEGGLIDTIYCHDMGRQGGDHVNGIQMENVADNPTLTIQNATILNQEEQADAIMLAHDEDGGTPKHVNRVIVHNLIGGGQFAVYGRGGPGGQSENITFTDNSFTTMFYPNSGSTNWEAYWDCRSGVGNVWARNIRDDTGATINPNC